VLGEKVINNKTLTRCASSYFEDRRGRDRVVVGFPTTYAIST